MTPPMRRCLRTVPTEDAVRRLNRNSRAIGASTRR
jgi:hypothetical protein